MCCLAATGLFAQQQMDLYVAPNGNDRFAGTKAKPLATLAGARDLIRDYRKKSGLPAGGISVWVRGGSYTVENAFMLTKEDAGEPGKPIRYQAYPKEKVMFSAMLEIAASQWLPLPGSAKMRLHPQVSTSSIVALDLRKFNLKHTRQFAPHAQFTDHWFTIDLFANGKRQPNAQWPNPDALISAQHEKGWATCNGTRDSASFYYGPGGRPEDLDSRNELNADGHNRAARWKRAMDQGHELWLKGFWRVPWQPITSKLRSIDTAKNYVSLVEIPTGGMGSKYSAPMPEKPGLRAGSGRENWMLINSLEEIDQPGEWAIDFKDQMVYYYPPADLKTLRIAIADQNSPLIKLENTAYISLSGFELSGTLADAVELIDGQHNTIAGCRISNVAGNGVFVSGGHDHHLLGNTIHDTGVSGIVMTLQGDRQQLRPGNSSIKNNHIYRIGTMAFNDGIRLGNSVGITVAHNLLHDLPKSAIRTDLVNDCLFEYNEIHNIALRESDNGAFYNYGGWSTYGNVFRYNFIHHINRSNGFYCDDGDSGDTFYYNIVHDAIDALKFGGGHDNIARNNVFINSKSQVIDDRGISRNYKTGTAYEQRLLDMKPLEEPWKSYGKRLGKQYGHQLWADILRPEWHPEYPHGCAVVDNVSINGGPFLRPETGKVVISGNAVIRSISAARFYNYSEMDLRSSAPAILKKFPALNTEFLKIGLYRDRFRDHLPSRKAVGGLENRGAAGKLYNEDQFID